MDAELQAALEQITELVAPRDATIACVNCGLPIEQFFDPWGRVEGWHHVTLTEKHDEYVMWCPTGGEAEPCQAIVRIS